MPELGIGTAAQAHLAFAMHNIGYASDVNGFVYHSDDIVNEQLHIKEGYLYPPSGPGLRRQPKRRQATALPHRLMRFRPCIDLHQGQVKQIVGSSLNDRQAPTTNFVAQQDAAYFANLYLRDNLPSGHVIMLGPGNEQAAAAALQAYPQGLQLGGGIHAENAEKWLAAGAAQLIATSTSLKMVSLSRITCVVS